MTQTTLSEKPTELKINYKEYPEFMFAMISAFLPEREGEDLRLVAGDVTFRHEKDGVSYKNGLIHSYNDLPAVVKGNIYEWYKNGQFHREGDLPARIEGDRKTWYIDGDRHREGDKPAYVSKSTQLWFKNGKLHRECDQPAYIDDDQTQWFKNGSLHREGDKPASINKNGLQLWYINGDRHR